MSLKKSADFAIDKSPDRPCPNLRSDDFGCRIHDQLRDQGFPGCIAYDCFGAGQRITRSTFSGRTWRDDAELAATIFPAFMTMTGVHEVLWQLDRALTLCDGPLAGDGPLRASVADELDRTNALGELPGDELARLDVVTALAPAMELVKQVSRLARAGLGGPDLAGVPHIGADLRKLNLRGANLRGAVLLGADLRRVDLALADLGGADLRAARLGGADLSRALFLRQGCLESAHGDTRTRLPDDLRCPSHWSRRPQGK